MLASYPWEQAEVVIVVEVPVDKGVWAKVFLKAYSIDDLVDLIVAVAWSLKCW